MERIEIPREKVLNQLDREVERWSQVDENEADAVKLVYRNIVKDMLESGDNLEEVIARHIEGLWAVPKDKCVIITE